MTPLPSWLSRALALALLAGALAAPVLGVVLPLGEEYGDAKARVAQDAMTLERYQRIAARLSQQRATLATLAARRDRQDGFLSGGNDSLIGARLQDRIKTAAEAARAELRTTQLLPPRADGDFRAIALRVEMTGALPALQNILYDIETSTPTLFVDNIDLRAHPMDRRDGSDDDPPLDASFEVYGYVRAER